jgi:AsnC-like ligand binding domain
MPLPVTRPTDIPASHLEPTNAQILAVSEDQIQGFVRNPMALIAEKAGLPVDLVIERIRTMLTAGTIRRVRQTLISTDLAPGALVAWEVPEEKLDAAFDWMFRRDPFSGHVVIRSTDRETAGSQYRLWTTLKVPQGYSMEKHGAFLCEVTGATAFRLMPAKGIFALGVGHVRRTSLEPGTKAEVPAVMHRVEVAQLSDLEWRVLVPLKAEFTPEEITEDLWRPRAAQAGLPLEDFYQVAEELNRRKVVGRFSTFLEHVKPTGNGERVTRFNALFHWAVPPGREIEAGAEVGRHVCMTHCYWREGGPDFRNVNIMGVVHGTDKGRVLEHKAAIDRHLEQAGIPFSYTNVFWGGRSEIKPSEIAPPAYAAWCSSAGLDPAAMRTSTPA